MKYVNYHNLLLLILWLGLLSYAQADNNDALQQKSVLNNHLSKTDFWPGRIIVKFREGMQNSRKRFLRSRINATLIKTWPLLDAELWQINDVATAILEQQRHADPDIESMQPDYVIRASDIKSANNGIFRQRRSYRSSADNMITVEPEETVLCAVLDSGVDYTHPDLMSNIWQNPGEIPNNRIDDDGNGYVDDVHGYDFVDNDGDPMDDCGQGTHVAGIIAGLANDDENIGISVTNWPAKIMALKILKSQENSKGITECIGSQSEVISALVYVQKNADNMGIKCTHNSWWGKYSFDSDLVKTLQTETKTNEGRLFIAAAGDGFGQDNDIVLNYPASEKLDTIISVCSVNEHNNLSNFSNFGQSSVDLCALGEKIKSTYPNNEYANHNGTSMAASYVTNAITLLWSMYPHLTAQEIKTQLMASVDKIPALADSNVMGGRLNLRKAITHLQQGGTSQPVQNIMAVAHISHTEGCAPLKTTLDARSHLASDIKEYKWIVKTHQDVLVKTVSEKQTSLLLEQQGVYLITLSVSDNQGGTYDETSVIAVKECGFSVCYEANLLACEGGTEDTRNCREIDTGKVEAELENRPLIGKMADNWSLMVELDANCSTEQFDGEIVEYQWELDGKPAQLGKETTISLNNSKQGNHIIALRAIDRKDNTNVARIRLTLQKLIATAQIGSPIVSLGEEVQLEAVVSHVADFSYKWQAEPSSDNAPSCEKMKCFFNDNTAHETKMLCNAPDSIEDIKSCTYTVILEVTDAMGIKDKTEEQLLVTLPPPIPQFTLGTDIASDIASLAVESEENVYSGIVPLIITFDGSKSSSLFKFSIVDYRWTFSCETEDDSGEIVRRVFQDLGKVVTRTFEEQGECTVELMVTDENDFESVIPTIKTIILRKQSPPVKTSKPNNGNGDTPFGENQVTSSGTSQLSELSIFPTSHTFPDLFFIQPSHKQKGSRTRNFSESGAKSFPEKTDYWPGRVVIKFREGTRRDKKRFIRNQSNATFVETLPLTHAEVWQVENVETAITAVIAAQQRYSNSDIEYIEPDYVIYPLDIIPNYSYSEDKLWGLHKIEAKKAWEVVQSIVGEEKLEPVICAVIDSGVDYTHPDLAPNMWHNPDEIPNNDIDDDGNGFVDDIYGYDFVKNNNDPTDNEVCGHGTHVAGILAGVSNEQSGIVGVNPLAKIMALKISEKPKREPYSGAVKCPFATTAAIKALGYAVEKDVKCSVNSWGGHSYNQQMFDAIQKAGEMGHLFIAAAGNMRKLEKTNIDKVPYYPASYELENIISVCSTNKNDSLSSFSNEGQENVDLCAPGANIYSTFPGGYNIMQGTSMAAAYVAGAVTLLWSVFPDLTVSEVKMHLMASAEQKNLLEEKNVTSGRLNVHHAIRGAKLQRQTFNISNTGKANLIIHDIIITGKHHTDFQIWNGDRCRNQPTLPNKTCTVDVIFKPMSTGTYEALLEVSSNAPKIVIASLYGKVVENISNSIPGDFTHLTLDRAEPSTYVVKKGWLEIPTVAMLNAMGQTEIFQAKLCRLKDSLTRFKLCDLVRLDTEKKLGDATYDAETDILHIPVIEIGMDTGILYEVKMRVTHFNSHIELEVIEDEMISIH